MGRALWAAPKGPKLGKSQVKSEDARYTAWCQGIKKKASWRNIIVQRNQFSIMNHISDVHIFQSRRGYRIG
jgi:phosphomevalonate kinase